MSIVRRPGRGRVRSRSESDVSLAASSDGSALFSDPAFAGHLADAEVRSALLDALIAARGRRKLTQEAVAKEMCTTQSAISELEGGATDPRLSTLQRYTRAVGEAIYVSLDPYNVEFEFSAETYEVISSYSSTVLPNADWKTLGEVKVTFEARTPETAESRIAS